jgi:hypothetical protein
MALNCAIGAGQLFGRESYEETERNVRRIHDSALIRTVLKLHHWRLTPALQFCRAAKGVLRRQVKQFLYQS